MATAGVFREPTKSKSVSLRILQMVGFKHLWSGRLADHGDAIISACLQRVHERRVLPVARTIHKQ